MPNTSDKINTVTFRKSPKTVHTYTLENTKGLSLLIEEDTEISQDQRTYRSYLMMEQYGITVDNGEFPAVDENGIFLDPDTVAGQIIQKLYKPIAKGTVIRNIDPKIIELRRLHDAIFKDEFPMKNQWDRAERMYYKNIIGFRTAKNVTEEAITDILTDYDITFYADGQTELLKGGKVTYIGIKSEDLPTLKKKFTTIQIAKNEYECTINNFEYNIPGKTRDDMPDLWKILKDNGIEPVETIMKEVWGEKTGGRFFRKQNGLMVRYDIILTISPNDRKKFESLYPNLL